MPAEQLKQVLAPSSDVRPGGQGLHAVCPVVLMKLPAWHMRHSVASTPVEYVPVGQSVHKPVVSPIVPGPHSTQTEAPSTENRPRLHVWHSMAPSRSAYAPAWQAWQAVLARPLARLPAAHVVHPVLPLALEKAPAAHGRQAVA